MTEASTGSIPNARLFSLAISAFAVLAAEPLYLLVDTAVVGHLGTTALGALGIGATILSLVTLVGTFLEYGTTSRAARWFGAGRPEDGAVEGVQATWLAVIIGVVAVGLGELFAGPLCRALAGGSGPIASHAEAWLRIAIGGVPGILIVLAGNGWLRGVQDTRSPVLIVLAANAVSAIASPILVYPFGLGLVGSAVANLGAQIIASVLFVRALLHRRVALRPNRAVMSAQLVMGRDLFLRAAAFQAAFLTSAAVAARMGSAQLGAHQIALQLWEFSALLLDAFAIAAQSLIGAALGGGDGAQARTMAWRVARYGAWAGLAFGVVIGGAGFVLPQVFTSSPAVIHQAHILWPWFAAMQPAAGLVFALDGVLLGAGDVAFMRTLTVAAALVAFVPLDLAALHWHWGIGGVWAGLTAFIAVRLVGVLIRTKSSAWIVIGTQLR